MAAAHFAVLLLAAQSMAAIQPAEAPTAAENLEPIVRKAMQTALKDPLGAQLIRLRRASTASYICGQVNGKNSYGAYTGFQPFVITPDGKVQIAGGDALVGRAAAQFVALVCDSTDT